MKKILLTALLLGGTLWGAQDDSSIHVWGTCVSPYVRKVVTVLEEKQLKYTLHPILPKVLLEATEQTVPAEFEAISPLGKIPALQVGNFHVADSSVIASYLEKAWPQSSLYPANKENLAKTLWYEKYADTYMSDVFHQIFFEKFVKPNVLKTEVDEELIAKLMEKVPSILAYLESQLSKNQKQYLVEDHLTIADIAIAHHFASMQLCGIKLPLERYPLLNSYITKTLQHPSIQAALKKI